MITKLGALFGVPTTTVSALGVADVIDPKISALAATILGAIYLAAWAWLNPAIPWVGPDPPAAGDGR